MTMITMAIIMAAGLITVCGIIAYLAIKRAPRLARTSRGCWNRLPKTRRLRKAASVIVAFPNFST